MSDYAARLQTTKEFYPFERWASQQDTLEQYTDEVCGEAAQIFDRLIEHLTALGDGAPENKKLEVFQQAIEATNRLDEENGYMVFETGEAGEIVDLCNKIALAAGLDPKKYAGGEGPASLWRNW